MEDVKKKYLVREQLNFIFNKIKGLTFGKNTVIITDQKRGKYG